MPTLRVPLLGAVLLLLAAAVVVALVPAGLNLDRRVSEEIRSVAVEDLGRAPMILEDRNAAQAEALGMHAMSVAMTEGLQAAVETNRTEQATLLARSTADQYDENPVLISGDGEPIVGPPPGVEALDVLRRGDSWTGYVFHEGLPRAVGLVALAAEDGWSGAAGSSTDVDEELANTLAGLARADVTILGPAGDVVATTLDPVASIAVASASRGGAGDPVSEKVREVSIPKGDYWVTEGPLGDAGTVLFSRTLEVELAALPGVRNSLLFAGLLTLLLALGVGAAVALLLTRPVQGLAVAADRVAAGDFEAPVAGSRVEEIDRLGGAFRAMRDALRTRLEELADANQELEAKQERLAGLQAELIRQDRLTSSARMAAELAHEIRNPVANVRNCLEVVRRGLPEESEGARFADMAIDELLRMHELAEHLLDLNRPSTPGEGTCDPREVVSQVAALAGVGDRPVRVQVREAGEVPARAAIPPDALKQVLFNLVDNAAEASGDGARVEVELSRRNGAVRITVDDDGPGISDEALPHLFDPFFTTKEAVHGVGLGLFVAEGLVRRYGGRMNASNRADGAGASFVVEVPVTEVEA